MESRSPSIAAIAVIGRYNNPLHISLFPATGPNYEQERDRLEYSFMVNSCLDIFEARMPAKTVGHDFGLLHAIDERIAMYGWLTNTCIKLVIVVDMEGRPATNAEAGKTAILGLRNNDLTPAFHAVQTAYIRLLRNPFYVPDEHNPKKAQGTGSLHIASPGFTKEIERIAKIWYPGITTL
ncbi:Trafficking protein particle complex subunit 2-like protein [Acrodontium crateriforme]|uniref:Trafficking protein particle complex subunit 2-like protein n=1 Tax=Acrodontium crateriforme TaxID=150365 RepID=A0AAQ3M5S5_9PEZI|nr:Trafficking protein particle complex subunit 2-like protein [Acrodontium crateriforme]